MSEQRTDAQSYPFFRAISEDNLPPGITLKQFKRAQRKLERQRYPWHLRLMNGLESVFGFLCGVLYVIIYIIKILFALAGIVLGIAIIYLFVKFVRGI